MPEEPSPETALRPASFGRGWWEVYRDGRLVAAWPDAAAIWDVLRRSDSARQHVVIVRDAAGMAALRHVAYWQDGRPRLIPIMESKRRRKDPR